jgi:hypothetical protein
MEKKWDVVVIKKLCACKKNPKFIAMLAKATSGVHPDQCNPETRTLVFSINFNVFFLSTAA